MANQYSKTLEVVHHKCAEPSCDNMVRCTPSALRKGKKYCSKACAYKKAAYPRKYRDEEIAWIKDNILKLPTAELAKRFDLDASSFRRVVFNLRAAGHDIPVIGRGHRLFPKPKKVKEKKVRAKTYKKRAQPAKPVKEKKVKVAKEKKLAIVKPKAVKEPKQTPIPQMARKNHTMKPNSVKAPKGEPKRYETKKASTEGMRLVLIRQHPATWVYRKIA